MGTVKGKPGYNLDAPELIGQCLRCTKPECDNCLERSAGADARRAFDRWEDRVWGGMGEAPMRRTWERYLREDPAPPEGAQMSLF